jgi:riboflavin synthase
MFTGIIEAIGTITQVQYEGSNVHFDISSDLSASLKVDQSVAHEGVCLTVVRQGPEGHRVTAVAETLQKTSLAQWKVGRKVNLERCMPANGRFDGHIVQGHVDQVGKINRIKTVPGYSMWVMILPMATLLWRRAPLPSMGSV